jgi:hypothetical protein
LEARTSSAPATEDLLTTDEPSPELTPTRSDTCDKVDDWVTAHAEALPDSVAGLRPFPDQYRLAIFDALPPPKRSALVLEEVDQYRRATLLTRAERDVLNEAFIALGPEAYADEPDEAACAALGVFEARAAEVFGSRLESEVLTLLRPGRYDAPELTAPFCECNTAKDDTSPTSRLWSEGGPFDAWISC